jgi:hypothetical protein
MRKTTLFLDQWTIRNQSQSTEVAVPIGFISSFALKLSNVRLMVKGWLPEC